MALSQLWHDYLGLRASHPRVFVHFTVAFFFLSVSLLLAASIVVTKIAKVIRNRKLERLRTKYDALIGEVILNSETAQGRSFTERQQFLIDGYKAKYLNSTMAQNAMIERMLDLKRSIEGNLELKLVTLYKALDLHINSINKIKSRRWHLRIKGMKEASEMQVKEAQHLIIGQVTDPNDHVKREAQIALIKLEPKNPLYFLNKPGIYITRWQELRIHRFIKKYASSGVPSFKKWLNTSNPSVLKMVLRMIGLFQQIDASDAVAGFLVHEDPGVQRMAVKTLLDLEAFQWSESIYQSAISQKTAVDPIYLTALAELYAGKDVRELAFSLLETENYQLKKEAARALLKLGVSPLDISTTVAAERRPAVEKILAHLNDPLLA